MHTRENPPTDCHMQQMMDGLTDTIDASSIGGLASVGWRAETRIGKGETKRKKQQTTGATNDRLQQPCLYPTSPRRVSHRIAPRVTHLLCSEVRRGVDEEWFIPDVLLDLFPRFLPVSEAFLRQGNLPVGNVNVRLDGAQHTKERPNRKPTLTLGPTGGRCAAVARSVTKKQRQYFRLQPATSPNTTRALRVHA